MKTMRGLSMLLVLGLLSGCGGGGRSVALESAVPGGTTASGQRTIPLTLTIPAASTAQSTLRRTPQTVSSQTQSITVSVNGATPQIFNAAPPVCTGTATITCTLNVGAPFGLDSFLIITYSGPNGTGTALNAAAVTLSVSSSGPNSASATAGNLLIVNNATDASGPSYSCAGGTTTCTLREAVGEASTTAGVFTAIMFQGVTSITLTSPIAIGSNGAQNILLLGPGATAANSSGGGAPAASSNLTIGGGNATQLFYINSGSTLDVDGLTLSGGVAADNQGGAIENEGGTLAITNAVFNANGSASSIGGAVYDSGSNPTTIVASTFTNNRGSIGGAYYNDDAGTIGHSLFANNSAFDGANGGAGGAIYTDGDLAVDSTTFTGNVAGSRSAAGAFFASGGAIFVDDYVSNGTTVTNSTFGGSSASVGNYAGADSSGAGGIGGAISNASGLPLTISGNTFANNVAQGGNEAVGGAISDAFGTASTGDTFSGNVADTSMAGAQDYGWAFGGAVVELAPNSFTGATFSGNQAIATSSAVAGEAFGGGLAAYDPFGGVTPTTSVTQSTFSSNSAAAGGLCVGGGVVVGDAPSNTETFTNDQFTGNSCTANGTQGYPAAYAGGLAVGGALVDIENTTFSQNAVSAAGDGVSTYGLAIGGGFQYDDAGAGGGCGNGCSVQRRTPSALKKTSFSATAASRAKSGLRTAFEKIEAYLSRHVPLKAKHFTATLPAAKAKVALKRPLASVGGGGGSGLLADDTFTGNTASGGPNGSAYGGGADISGSTTMTSDTFSNNSATASGASAFGAGGGFSNSGTVDGMYCGIVPFSGTVTGNTATTEGGGVWNYCQQMTIVNSTIAKNTVTAPAYAGDGGGGIWNDNSLAISGSTITGNSVGGSLSGSGGGGVMNYYASIAFTNSTIYANSSSVDGGGVENCCGSSSATFVNATVYQNTASGKGGNVDNENGSGSDVMNWQNTIVAGGTATGTPDSADFYNGDTINDYDYNLIQTIATSSPGSGTCIVTKGSAPCPDDIVGQAPLLGALSSLGGPTQTLGDAPTSPGRAYIPFSGGLCNGASGTNVDQRGYIRGSGGKCDVGAFEFAGTAP